MLKIVLATGNPHKVEEINKIAKDFGCEFVLPPSGFDPVENGDTFGTNALIKAKEANENSKMLTLADDSGLCVDALNGEPGIYSARYAGTQSEKIQKLLNAMKEVPENRRGAKFVCAMVLLDSNGEVLFSDRGECYGKIAYESKGTNGFGYDPIFIVDGSDLTMAQLPEDVKNTISHRAIALQKIIEFLTINKKYFLEFTNLK